MLWPTEEEVVAEARFWAHDVRAVLWTQLTAPRPQADPVRIAWLAARFSLDGLRFSLDGLRYRYLAHGARSTAAADLLAMAAAENAPTLDAVRIALDTATERRPPRVGARERLLTAALSTVD
jgi:hypothetical protein